MSALVATHPGNLLGRSLPSEKIYTSGQVAKLCHVAPRTVSKWFDSGRLKGYRLPGSDDRRIPASKLLAFMREHDFPVPAELVTTPPSAVIAFGRDMPLPGATVTGCPFAFGELVATERVRVAVVDDSEGLAIARRACEALRARHPEAVIVLVVSDDVADLTDANATEVIQRPVDWPALIARLAF